MKLLKTSEQNSKMLFVKETHTSHTCANVQTGEWKMYIKLLTGFSSGKKGMTNRGNFMFYVFLIVEDYVRVVNKIWQTRHWPGLNSTSHFSHYPISHSPFNSEKFASSLRTSLFSRNFRTAIAIYLQTDYTVEDSECESTQAELSLGAEKNTGLLGQKYDMIKPVSRSITTTAGGQTSLSDSNKCLRMDSNAGKVLKGIQTNWRKSKTKPWQQGRAHSRHKPLV